MIALLAGQDHNTKEVCRSSQFGEHGKTPAVGRLHVFLLLMGWLTFCLIACVGRGGPKEHRKRAGYYAGETNQRCHSLPSQ
jgi:hypothetical protein